MYATISLFRDKKGGGIAVLQSFKNHYYGYEDVDVKHMPDYMNLIEDLVNKFLFPILRMPASRIRRTLLLTLAWYFE